MNLPVQIEILSSAPAAVEYRWDVDTDILTARVHAPEAHVHTSGSVEIMGEDGAWINMDVQDGHIHAIEIAVWPEVRTRPALVPPTTVEDAAVVVGSGGVSAGLMSIAVDTALSAETDAAERTVHFRFGGPRRVRVLRVAQDVLLEVDGAPSLAGVWLLNVPPCPTANDRTALP